MTKNVTFHDLFSDLTSIKHDFYRRGVKLSETNHTKNIAIHSTAHRKIKGHIFTNDKLWSFLYAHI